MWAFNTLIILAFIALAIAQVPFDPSGGMNVGNGVGGQFIGGQCLSNSDCGSTCCANPTGICSTLSSSSSDGKTGCGFPSGQGQGTGTSAGSMFDPSGDQNLGNRIGSQFIGGQCLNAADCASGCCAGPAGICSGVESQMSLERPAVGLCRG